MPFSIEPILESNPMKTDNTPAFPHHEINRTGGIIERIDGLSKRELFAGMAMQGMAAKALTDGSPLDALALWAVEYADALLAELAKEAE